MINNIVVTYILPYIDIQTFIWASSVGIVCINNIGERFILSAPRVQSLSRLRIKVKEYKTVRSISDSIGNVIGISY